MEPDPAVSVDPVVFVDPADAPSESGGDLDIEILETIERELAEVERALERLGDGSYGRCESCGQVMSEDELEAAPASRFCRAHLPAELS